MNLSKIVIYILSPTYLYADYVKEHLDERAKASFILKKNRRYFILTLITFFLFLLLNNIDKLTLIDIKGSLSNYQYPLLFLLFYYLVSRVNEIFISFILDVFEKLNKNCLLSFISFKERIKLAFFSYIELIFNYALMFWIIYYSFGLFNNDDLTLLNMLYYSGVTITSLGYGDIYAIHFIPQLLSVYEVFNGMIIVIVCFTIYVSLNFNKSHCYLMEKAKKNYTFDQEQIKENYKRFKKINKRNLLVASSVILLIYIGFFLIVSKAFPTNIFFSFIIYLLFSLLIVKTISKNQL